MSDSSKDKKADKSKYLKAAGLFSMAWALAVYFVIGELKNSGGITYLVRSIEEGIYSPVIYLAISVILLAYALKNFAAFFKSRDIDE